MAVDWLSTDGILYPLKPALITSLDAIDLDIGRNDSDPATNLFQDVESWLAYFAQIIGTQVTSLPFC